MNILSLLNYKRYETRTFGVDGRHIQVAGVFLVHTLHGFGELDVKSGIVAHGKLGGVRAGLGLSGVAGGKSVNKILLKLRYLGLSGDGSLDGVMP